MAKPKPKDGNKYTKRLPLTPAMIKAFLDGDKTVTRRVINPQPDENGLTDYTTTPPALDQPKGWYGQTPEGESRIWHCPYGVPGDIIPISEAIYRGADGLAHFAFDDEIVTATAPGGFTRDNKLIAAQGEPVPWVWQVNSLAATYLSTALIRHWALNAGVRAERVQDISESQARAEGVEAPIQIGQLEGDINRFEPMGYRFSFAELWNSINEGRGYGWDTNPWVFAIGLKTVEG